MSSHERAHPSPLTAFLRETAFPQLRETRLFVYLGRHMTKDDAREALDHALQHDVVIPEMVAWYEDMERTANMLSQGTVALSDGGFTEMVNSNFNNYFNILFEGLTGSRKLITFADVPESQASELTNAVMSFASLPDDIRARSWSRPAARQLYIARITKVLATNAIRERHIAESIGPAIARVAQNDPSRETRTSLSICMTIGTDHEPILPLLEKLHGSVSVIHQEQGRFITHSDEVNQKIVAGEEVPEELVDGALMESLLNNGISRELESKLYSGVEYECFMRSIAESMSDAEREELHRVFVTANKASLAVFIDNLVRIKCAQ